MPIGVKIGVDLEGRIRDCLLAGKSLRAAAAECGSNCGVVQRVLKEMRADGLAESIVAAPGVEPDDEHPTWSEAGDSATVTARTSQRIRTEADAIRVCRVDTGRWKVVGMEIRPYQTAMKLSDREESEAGVRRIIRERPHVVQLFAIKLKLELIAPRPYLDATEALFTRLESRAPLFDFPALSPPEDSPYLLAINLFDVHFGKLCWAPETGDNYDLKIASAVFRNAIEDLLRLVNGFPIGRILFLVGNDLHHVDTLSRTTTAGTPQDVDSRYFKMVDVVETSVLWGVHRMMERARVDAVYMGGNHDRIASWHLCRTLRAFFRNHTDRIEVDISPQVRKYRDYGVNLLGFTHGHQAKDPSKLATLMAIEAPEKWAKSKCREWFVAHNHTKRDVHVASAVSREHAGVHVHWVSSPAGTDAYHFEEGYVGNRKAAEARLYSLERGFVANFEAEARY